MAFQSFQELLPDVAEHETRSLTIIEETPGMPPVGQYMFAELFCNELDCDCRNAMIVVGHVETGRTITQLRYCWETQSYYEGIGLYFGEKVPGIFVDIGPTTPYGEFFANTLKQMCYGGDDPKRVLGYGQRVQKHYQQFRQQLIHEAEADDLFILQSIPQPYDPCTCVSGKKYKFCCKPIFECIVEAMCAAEDGLHEEAIRWITKAEKIVGNTAEVLCRKAIIYSFTDMQRYAEYLQKCLEANPRHPRAHYLQGVEYKKKGNMERAVQAYLRAIEYYLPTDHFHLNEVYNNLAGIYHAMGDHAKAKATWKIALDHAPTDKMTRMNLQQFGKG